MNRTMSTSMSHWAGDIPDSVLYPASSSRLCYNSHGRGRPMSQRGYQGSVAQETRPHQPPKNYHWPVYSYEYSYTAYPSHNHRQPPSYRQRASCRQHVGYAQLRDYDYHEGYDYVDDYVYDVGYGYQQAYDHHQIHGSEYRQSYNSHQTVHSAEPVPNEPILTEPVSAFDGLGMGGGPEEQEAALDELTTLDDVKDTVESHLRQMKFIRTCMDKSAEEKPPDFTMVGDLQALAEARTKVCRNRVSRYYKKEKGKLAERETAYRTQVKDNHSEPVAWIIIKGHQLKKSIKNEQKRSLDSKMIALDDGIDKVRQTNIRRGFQTQNGVI